MIASMLFMVCIALFCIDDELGKITKELKRFNDGRENNKT